MYGLLRFFYRNSIRHKKINPDWESPQHYNKMKKFRNFLLAITCLGLCQTLLVSCDKEDETDQGTNQGQTQDQNLNEHEQKICGKWSIYCEEENYSDIMTLASDKTVYWDGESRQWSASKDKITIISEGEEEGIIFEVTEALFEYNLSSEDEMTMTWLDRWDGEKWEFTCTRID